MSKLHVDFKNKIVGVEMGELSTLRSLEVKKSQVREYIPEEYYDIADCFTFDFDREKVCLDRPIVLDRVKEMTLQEFVSIKEKECKGITNKSKELFESLGMKLDGG